MSKKIVGATVGTGVNVKEAIKKTPQAEQIEKNTQDISNLSATVNDQKTEVENSAYRSKYNRGFIDRLNGIFDFGYASSLEYSIVDIQNIVNCDKPNDLGMYKLLDIYPTKAQLDTNGISFTYSSITQSGTAKTINIPIASMIEEEGVLIGFDGDTPVFMVVPKDGVKTEDTYLEGGFYASILVDGRYLSDVVFGTYDLMVYKLKDGVGGAEVTKESIETALGYTPANQKDIENVGKPTDEQISGAVSDWLDEHPEATTTIADGVVGFRKLADDVGEKIKNCIKDPAFEDITDNNKISFV